MSEIKWEGQEIILTHRRKGKNSVDRFIFTKLYKDPEWKCLLRVVRIIHPHNKFDKPAKVKWYWPEHGEVWVYRKFSSLERAKAYASVIVGELEDPNSFLNKGKKKEKKKDDFDFLHKKVIASIGMP